MNQVVKAVQDNYRQVREKSNYSIMDIGMKLGELADEGLVWIVKSMKDISEQELILVEYYLNQNFEKQIYDNLEINLRIKTS